LGGVWLRFAGAVIAMVLPVLAALVVAFLASVGEETAGALLVSGLPWGLLL
jgi:hypothetical protein